MQTQCAHTCGFCKAPEGLIPFASLGKDCSGFGVIGDFWGHFQMKQGSTMDKGTFSHFMKATFGPNWNNMNLVSSMHWYWH